MEIRLHANSEVTKWGNNHSYILTDISCLIGELSGILLINFCFEFSLDQE